MNTRSKARFFTTIALMVLVLSTLSAFCSCGASDEQRISDALSTELDQVKNHDSSYLDAVLGDDAKQTLTTVGIEPEAFMAVYLDGFDYRIDSINVDKDSATAQVSIAAKSLSSITSQLQADAQASVNAGTGSNLTEEEIQQQVSEQALGYARDAQLQDKPAITISLKRTESVWTVDPQTRSVIEQVLL